MEERKEIKRLIDFHGGKFSGQMTRRTTHLITATPSGEKYSAAIEWKTIHIVTTEWLYESIKKVIL